MKRATDEVQEDVARLTAQLNSLRKDTDEFKVVKHSSVLIDERNFFVLQKVKRKIRDKYLGIQEVGKFLLAAVNLLFFFFLQDKDYQKRKERFLLLHYKLAHVKKMVMEYDSLHGLQDQTLS